MIQYTYDEGVVYMKQRLQSLFSAHHADKNFLIRNCGHYYCEKMSIAAFIDSPECTSLPYQHQHEAYEFLIPYGPIPLVMCEDEVYFGEVGYVYPIPKGQEHGFKALVTNISYDTVVIDADFLEDILRQKGYTGRQLEWRFELTPEQKSYIQLFKDEFKNGRGGNSDKLQHLAALITTSFIDSEFRKHGNNIKRPSQYQQGILQVAAYINQHYTEALKLEDLAAMCHLSKTYFITAFKKVIGESPYSYLLLLRIAKARTLLETTDYTIKEVANLSGFQHTNTFTSHFRTVTHMTPSEYREHIRK